MCSSRLCSPFHFLVMSFEEQTVLILIDSNLLTFSFMVSVFCVLRTLCLTQGQRDSLLYMSFIISAFMSRFMIHLELIFEYDLRVFFLNDISCFSTIY